MHTMATGIVPVAVPVSVSAGNRLKPYKPSNQFLQMPVLTRQRNSARCGTTTNFSIRAQYNRSDSRGGGGGGGGGDFVTGFFLGGAIFGTLAYAFAPQIRRALLQENEHGFRIPRRPIYYDEGSEIQKTRQILNDKISQLNSAIDNVYWRLRGGNNMHPMPVEEDPEEATL